MVKNENVRIMITLSKKEFSILEDLSRESGLSKSIIVKIALSEKLEKIQNLSNFLR